MYLMRTMPYEDVSTSVTALGITPGARIRVCLGRIRVWLGRIRVWLGRIRCGLVVLGCGLVVLGCVWMRRLEYTPNTTEDFVNAIKHNSCNQVGQKGNGGVEVGRGEEHNENKMADDPDFMGFASKYT